MPEFYITFGQKWRRQEHPKGGHPDGWCTIIAESEERALEGVFAICGPEWAGIYSEKNFDRSFYPKGELWRETFHND